MCVGVPMQIVEINYPSGVAETKGVKRQIGLQLLPEGSLQIGDHVIIHVGFAIEKIEREHADEIWEYLDEILRVMDEEDEGA
ncbi:MAG TPA: HypC/HybG/HupF family hydrogenase formation chaperone [Nitrospirae bacterium]|nr:HypC/HybG/HupF family hydrogenase formation chaperone [Nitrospirota bacterium]HDL20956.1 HypC/HybG/HupF family hydrogenase formation chaperone [Nitrospirota bacterium]HDZ01557.1 HypC/HybG/HupF family hydrogenase formation chaperone [Nitrospirota bacterium]